MCAQATRWAFPGPGEAGCSILGTEFCSIPGPAGLRAGEPQSRRWLRPEMASHLGGYHILNPWPHIPSKGGSWGREGGGQKDLQSQAGSWGYKAVRMSTLECGALSILSGRGLPLTQSYGSTAVRRGVPSPGQETNNSTPSRHLISLIPAAGSPGAASSRLHIPLRRTFHGGGK